MPTFQAAELATAQERVTSLETRQTEIKAELAMANVEAIDRTELGRALAWIFRESRQTKSPRVVKSCCNADFRPPWRLSRFQRYHDTVRFVR